MKSESSIVYVYRGPRREIPWREIKRAIGAQLETGAALALTITCKATERIGPSKHQPPLSDEVIARERGEHRRATLADVAREAKVSTSTVSRVLNDYGASSQKARARVEAAMRRVDYKPNEAARTMVHSKRTKQSIFTIADAPPLHDSVKQD